MTTSIFFFFADGGNAEHRLDVDNADAADFHVVLDDRFGFADERVADARNADGVVGDKTVPALYEIEDAFRLADVAIADVEHAHAIDIDETCVDGSVRGEELFQEPLSFLGEIERGKFRGDEGRVLLLAHFQ